MTTYMLLVLGGRIMATTNREAHEAKKKEFHAKRQWPEVHVITPAYCAHETLEEVTGERGIGRVVEYYSMEEHENA